VATEKRERQRANRQLKQEAQVKEHRRATTKRRVVTYGLGLLALFAAVIGLAALGGAFSGDDDETTLEPITSSTTPSVDDSTAPTAEPGTTLPGIDGATPCPEADGSSERVGSFSEAPPMCIDPEATYTADVATNFGDLTIDLDAAAAPNTVNNFVVLARYHYFDGTPCHRAITGFMVQCGDPTGTGTGDPGYEFDNENPASNEDYTLGAVAMANSGPDTNGSQFFITTSDSSPSLETNYSLFGQVTDGLDTTLTALDALGSNPDADNGVPPSEPIIIESVTITES
jgi:peptidyl-prolyl cis-trans isomerase B (cyclophilin B)